MTIGGNSPFAPVSLEELTKEYEAFLDDTAYPRTDAENLLLEIWNMIDDCNDPHDMIRLKLDVKWLSQFIRKWEASEEHTESLKG